MVKIGNLITSLEINGKKVNNPDWWYTKHRLKKTAKTQELIRQNSEINCKASYMVTDPLKESYTDYLRKMSGDICNQNCAEAWWKNNLSKGKTIIVFKK